jgi:lipopolysaccharide assembly outer membrane protein LptD (OstA)
MGLRALARLVAWAAALVAARAGAPARAQGASGPALTREPDIARDEARVLIPQGEAAKPSIERLEIAPSEQRKRLADLREALNPATRAQAIMRVRALEGYLDYDDEDQIVYGPGRTRVTYKGFTLEADRVLLDSRLQEVQAEGTVELTTKNGVIHAQSLRYNFNQSEGVAYKVNGQYMPVYFHARQPADPRGTEPPQFQMISEHESIMRKTELSSCDFAVPHYYMRGREVAIYPEDRVFFRGATFYLMGVPVFYMPVYTRSLKEASPWFATVGYNSTSGARLRLGYSYHHETQEPSSEDDKKMETSSRGHADVYFDYVSKLGEGMGVDYDYEFDRGKAKGQMSVYGLDETNYKRYVFGATEPDSTASHDGMSVESERWRFKMLHKQQVTDNLSVMLNIDEFSDPDIFYDVLDLFNSEKEQTENLNDLRREPERGATVAATYVKEQYVLRMMAQTKDRIGLNRLNNYSMPTDNDLDWNLDPYNKLTDTTADGIGSHRWGTVSNKLQADAATSWLPWGQKGWFYHAELHLYDSLDKGLNTVDATDDAQVAGSEFYQQVMRQWKLGERYTLVGRAGFGVGEAERSSDGLGYDVSTMGTATSSGQTYPRTIDNLTFINDKTFLIGTKEKSYDQIKPSYVWGDTEWKLNARFSDELSGWLRWRYRKTTTDFLGDWYASLGDLTVPGDLYNYKLRENWLEGQLDYSLYRPLLTAYVGIGANLESSADLYANEAVNQVTTGLRWTNKRQTLIASSAITVMQRQIYDPTDPAQYQETEWYLNQGFSYTPKHGRWYLRLTNNVSLTQNATAESSDSSQYTYFSDQNTDDQLDIVYGRHLGPKWFTRIVGEYKYQSGSNNQLKWILERDMHDAIGILQFRVESKDDSSDSGSSNGFSNMSYDMRAGIKFKLPAKDATSGASDIHSLSQQVHQAAVAD